MEIRHFKPSEIDGLVHIEDNCNQYPWKKETILSCFGERYFNAAIFKADEMIGYYIGEHILGEATLMNIGVLTQEQGKGVGQTLLNHFVAQCKALNNETVWLEVRQSNIGAITLYEKAGFEHQGIRKNYYPCGDNKEHAVIMNLTLI